MSFFAPDANRGQSRELLPDGLLCYVHVKPKDKDNSDSTGGEYFNLECTVIAGTFQGRKVFSILNNLFDERNKKGGRDITARHLQRIYETLGIFQPQHQASYAAFNGCTFDQMMQTIEQAGEHAIIPALITVEEAKNGYAAKNRIEFLSGNQLSHSHKDWEKLKASPTGEVIPPPKAISGTVPPTATGPIPPGLFQAGPGATAQAALQMPQAAQFQQPQAPAAPVIPASPGGIPQAPGFQMPQAAPVAVPVAAAAPAFVPPAAVAAIPQVPVAVAPTSFQPPTGAPVATGAMPGWLAGQNPTA